MIDQNLIIASIASVIGGWFLRSVVDRLIDRSDSDHDELIKLKVQVERLTNDVNAAHDKIRQYQQGV